MIGILGGMGTLAGLDFCNKLAMLNAGKIDNQYPFFLLYNKVDVPKRPENFKRYKNVLESLYKGCLLLQKNKCKFIAIPCNTAHYWYEDLQKKVNVPIINMPEAVYNYCKRLYKKNSKIGLLATQGTLESEIYTKFFEKNFKLLIPNAYIQQKHVNLAIKYVKMGKIQKAKQMLNPVVNNLKKRGCKKIILGCSELPLAVKKDKNSKIFLDANLILAIKCMNMYRK